MTASFDTANNEILATFKAAWDTTGYPALYENVKGEKPAADTPWARLTVRHATGGQATLSNENGVRRYNREGFLVVQIFIPVGTGLSQGYDLSKIVADAFDGAATSSAVWFRNVRVNEVGPSGEWFQINVLIDFTYDEVK